MTDAKDAYKLGSMQYKEEWEVYHNVLKETQVEKKTKWIDLRGNHGMFIKGEWESWPGPVAYRSLHEKLWDFRPVQMLPNCHPIIRKCNKELALVAGKGWHQNQHLVGLKS